MPIPGFCPRDLAFIGLRFILMGMRIFNCFPGKNLCFLNGLAQGHHLEPKVPGPDISQV